MVFHVNVWLDTQTGREELDRLCGILSRPAFRVCLFLGPYGADELKTALNNVGLSLNGITLAAFPDENSLICWDGNWDAQRLCVCIGRLDYRRSSRNGLILVNLQPAIFDFIQRQHLTRFYAPYTLVRFDAEMIRHTAHMIVNPEGKRALRWIVDIAHDMAWTISGGCLRTYEHLFNDFLRAYERNPVQLPDIEQIIRRCDSLPPEQDPPILQELHGFPPLRQALIDNPQEQDWFILWSQGLAGRVEGIWRLDMRMLCFNGTRRELVTRVQKSCYMTMMPLCIAWTRHMTQKYNLREDTRWDPQLLDNTLGDMENISAEDKHMTSYIRQVRNWICHVEDRRSQVDECMRSCFYVINNIDP